ncbi:hypothetical protein HDU91_005671 [Kappamyces sp. JEL0680]|nr:hypothetical protein HDU91_005671 [Kappamyces sp. JEL0680]
MHAAALPPELWINILQNVSRGDLWNCRRVNRLFFYAAVATYDSKLRGTCPPKLLLYIDQSGTKVSYKMTADRIDRDWVEFRMVDEPFGFKGLGRHIQGICAPLFDPSAGLEMEEGQVDDEGPLCPFSVERYQNLGLFLSRSWETLQETIPTYLRMAYGTLFRHIIKVFETLCSRPGETMARNMQMSILIQVWRLVEMLAPKLSRDTRFECTPSSPGLDIRLEREFGTGEPDDRPCEFPTVMLFEQKIQVDWKWEQEDKGKIMKVSTEFKSDGLDLEFPSYFSVQGLQHGDDYDFLSLTDIRIKVPKCYLMCK